MIKESLKAKKVTRACLLKITISANGKKGNLK